MKTKPALKYFKCELTDNRYTDNSYPIVGLFIQKGIKTYLTRRIYKDGHFDIPMYNECNKLVLGLWTNCPYKKTYITYEEYVLESL